MPDWEGHKPKSKEALKAAKAYKPPVGIIKEGPAPDKSVMPGSIEALATARAFKAPGGIIREGPAPKSKPKPKPKRVAPTGTPGGPPIALVPKPTGDRKATPKEMWDFDVRMGKDPSKYKYKKQGPLTRLPPLLPPRGKVRPRFKIEIKRKPKPAPPGPDRGIFPPRIYTEMPGPKGGITSKGLRIPRPSKEPKKHKLVSFTTSEGKEVRFRTRSRSINRGKQHFTPMRGGMAISRRPLGRRRGRR